MTFPSSAYSSSIASADGSQRCFVMPYGQMKVSVDGASIFGDTFDGSTIDTVNRWNSPVLGGTGTVTQTNGSLTIATGTTASNAGALSSIEAFSRSGIGFLRGGLAVRLETPIRTNTHRFWGFGTPNASFTAATPLADAIGFEIDITGALNCVVYAGNTRSIVKQLPVPTDGIPHGYAFDIRDDYIFWFVDNFEVPVAAIAWTTPQTNTLPIRLHMINHTSGPASAPTFVSAGIGYSDSTGSPQIVFNGQSYSRARAPSVFKNINAVSIASEVTIWTPTSGRKFRLMGFVLESGTVSGNVLIKDNTAGTTILVIPFGAVGQTIVSPPMGNGILSAAANNVLTATGVATQTLSGYVFGTEE